MCTKEEAAKILKCKMSKLQFLYKKQMAVLSDKMLYERKKYLVMRRAEEEQPTASKQPIDRDDLELLKAARNYKPTDKMVTNFPVLHL